MNDQEMRNRYRRDYARESASSDRPKQYVAAHPTPRRSVITPTRTIHTPKIVSTLALPTPKIGTAQASKHRQMVKHRRRATKPIVLVAGLLILATTGGGLAYTILSKQPKPSQLHFPVAVTKNTPKTQLYYPANLPSGYTVNSDFKTPEANIVTYSVSDSKGNKYVIAVQPLPDDFNINSQKTKMLNPDTVNTSYGTAIVGTTVDGLLALIQTDANSLIIIHAINKDTQSQLETVVRSLQKPI